MTHLQAECRNGGHLGQFVNGVYVLPEHRAQNQEKEAHVEVRLGEEGRLVEKIRREVNPLAPRSPPPSPSPADDVPAQDDQEARPVVFEVGFETSEKADEWVSDPYLTKSISIIFSLLPVKHLLRDFLAHPVKNLLLFSTLTTINRAKSSNLFLNESSRTVWPNICII